MIIKYKKINKLSVLNNFTFSDILLKITKEILFRYTMSCVDWNRKTTSKGRFNWIQFLLNHRRDTNLLVGSCFITYKNIFWAMWVSIGTILSYYIEKIPSFAWKLILSNKQTQHFHKTITSDFWPWNTKILLMQNVYY